MDIPPPDTPIVCDLTDAPDTGRQRLAEYQRLFAAHLVGRERTAAGIRFRFRADPGVEPWVRDLAAREKTCCAFFAFDVTPVGGQVVWDAAVADNEAARAILDEFYTLPDTAAATMEGLYDTLTERGLRLASDPGDTVHRLQPAAGLRGSTAPTPSRPG